MKYIGIGFFMISAFCAWILILALISAGSYQEEYLIAGQTIILNKQADLYLDGIKLVPHIIITNNNELYMFSIFGLFINFTLGVWMCWDE